LDISALCTSETSRVTESKECPHTAAYVTAKGMAVVYIPWMRGTVVVAINE
jgi:hypothetical protein